MGSLKAIKSKVRGNKVETITWFDKNGNLINSISGQVNSVNIPEDALRTMKDCVVTHNHPASLKYPSGSMKQIGNSFSDSDLIVAIAGNVAEMRAVSQFYTFSIKRPTTGWPDENESIIKIAEIAKSVRNTLFQRVMNNTTTKEKANTVFWHQFTKEFARYYGADYKKYRIK